MSTLIHADIFFFVTTIIVVLVGIALTIALIYLAKVFSDIREITKQVKEETILFRGDIAGLRADVKREGFRLERLMTFFKTLIKRSRSSSKRSASKTGK